MHVLGLEILAEFKREKYKFSFYLIEKENYQSSMAGVLDAV